MKLFIAALALLAAFASAATVPVVERKKDMEAFCEPDRLTKLAECHCFVKSQDGTITSEMKALCVEQFGKLSALKESSCREYMTSGQVDVEALHQDIVEVDRICAPMFMDAVGDGNAMVRQELPTSNRLYCVVIIVILLIAA